MTPSGRPGTEPETYLAKITAVLAEPPDRRDGAALAATVAVLAVALALPPAGRPGGPGVAGAVKVALSLGGTFAGPAYVGFRRLSPAVAWAVAYVAAAVLYFGTGMWGLRAGTEPAAIWYHVYATLTFEVAVQSLVVTAAAYPLGAVAGLVGPRVRRLVPAGR